MKIFDFKTTEDKVFVIFFVVMCIAVLIMLVSAIFSIDDNRECLDEEKFITYVMVGKVLVPQYHNNCLEYKEDK